LTTSSNLLACTTGRSAPLRMTPPTAAFVNKRPIFFLPFVAVDAEGYVAR
jgi:hypothetical protein